MNLTVIVDNKIGLQSFPNGINFIQAIDFIDDKYDNHEGSNTIINLCSSYDYQKLGYYVSLIAEARGCKVIPSILTIQDVKTNQVKSIIDSILGDDIQKLLHSLRTDSFKLSIFFGQNISNKYSQLCRKIYGLFPVPLLQVHFEKNKRWLIKQLSCLSVNDIPENLQGFFTQACANYMQKKRLHAPKRKNMHYDMAILYNPNEKTAPSNPAALKKFIAAGNDLGIRVELIEKHDYKTLKEFDALFIRETTSVNNHTFKFSRSAMTENIVVVDDPDSILKCSNKVYLSELLTKKKIKSPVSIFLEKHSWKKKKHLISYPCVLKKPDGAFSKGVVKAHDEAELIKHTKELFNGSQLIVAQELVQSEFDWRIGIFNRQVLFACKYYMAEGHWQIYNWDSTHEVAGRDESVAISDVPEIVRTTALRASNLIGNGLYGVDLKQRGNAAYVIEINDNPNIDNGVEDVFNGAALYREIMEIFLRRIKIKHGYEQHRGVSQNLCVLPRIVQL